jgi:hypothetical protein
MAAELRNDNEQTASVTALVSGIVRDAELLLKQQFDLFKTELRQDAHYVEISTEVLCAGAFIGFVGLLLLGNALSLGLEAAWPDLPLWAWYAIVGAVVLVVGTVLTIAGVVKLHSVNPLPAKTAEGLKENFQWKTKPM